MRYAAVAAAAVWLVPATRAEEPKLVELRAGEVVNVCSTGIAPCPVSTSICDDPRVAVVENGPKGPELKGVAPGATLCSLLASGGGSRRLIRVTVRAVDARAR